MFCVYIHTSIFTDINECNTNPCDQVCNNEPGTYSCSCRSGFEKINPSSPTDPRCSGTVLSIQNFRFSVMKTFTALFTIFE